MATNQMERTEINVMENPEQDITFAEIDAIIARIGCRESSLIAVMQEVQRKCRYLPEPSLRYIAEKLGVSSARIFGVATFYENFSLEAKGKYVIKICDGTACHVRKSIPVLNALRKELALSEAKHTTDDRIFTLETVSCLGACGLAPVMTINDKVYPAMTPETAVAVLTGIRREEAEA